MSDLLGISEEEFARRLKAASTQADLHFAFFLGAGCSTSSGIPTAGELVRRHWLPQLRTLRSPGEGDLDAWAKTEFPDYDPGQPALIYGQVVERLFLQPEEAQREIERLCHGKFPSAGYAAMACLMAGFSGLFNVALTTNFDDLLQDALYLFTPSRPLVIEHESMARYIRPTRTRPLVVKLHGDQRLAPKNTQEETRRLEEQIEAEVHTLLHDRGLIFTGYGGHDRSIHGMLEHLPQEAVPLGVYWVNPEPPPEEMAAWLARRRGIWVKGGGDFDAWMLGLCATLEAPLPASRTIEGFIRRYRSTWQILRSKLSASAKRRTMKP